jgi:hypothetical protein
VLAENAITGSAEFSELDLVTGVEVRAPVALTGTPTAMAFGSDGRSALVATDQGGLWRLFEMRAGSSSLVASGASPPGPVRSVAALGAHAAVATIGDSLLRVDWIEPQSPRVTTILGGMATPWGVAVDRRRPDRVFVAENTAAGGGRVVAVELGSRNIRTVAPSATLPFPQPTSRWCTWISG